MSPQLRLPGFDLPLNHNEPTKPGNVLFKNPLNKNDFGNGMLRLTTLREFAMLNIMNKVTDKPDWQTKVFDDVIAQKWKDEMQSSPGADVTEAMASWCIAELRYKAKVLEKTGAISVFNGDVVKSDTAIPLTLKEALRAAVAPLEKVPTKLQDWHPGSDEKVLDLVHPSLYPLVYGRSRILSDGNVGLDNCIEQSGQGETIPIPLDNETQLSHPKSYFSFSPAHNVARPFSRQFQWLPCDVSLSDDANTVEITSYINNLHPTKNEALYTVIEQIIKYTIPLWNLTLTPLKASAANVPAWTRIDYSGCEYDPDPENGPATDGPQQEDDEDNDEYVQRRVQWYEETRRVVLPEPGPFHPPDFSGVPKTHRMLRFFDETEGLKPEYTVDLFRDFSESGLQVIVKLANIHLTPDKPTYEGGTWHIEGQLNEHICASAIYYYDNHNITDSKLAFRQMSDTWAEFDYPPEHHDWLPQVFGCEQHGDAVQDVGAADTPEGRLLTWPNILQHQVQPFKLLDATKPGHRKILAFFLVDPNIRIISTANVPCQQRDWWGDAIHTDNKESSLSTLPAELKEHIIQDVEDYPIGLDEAKSLRLKLMEERSAFVVEQIAAFNSYEISLCEH
ncbi:hypothetical protein DXG01_016398 [Tephrocybe rancida]|nr:hypothetical protein DXG01_016398 [Tephrocybe rancida]